MEPCDNPIIPKPILTVGAVQPTQGSSVSGGLTPFEWLAKAGLIDGRPYRGRLARAR